jgi:hypothetical protein
MEEIGKITRSDPYEWERLREDEEFWQTIDKFKEWSCSHFEDPAQREHILSVIDKWLRLCLEPSPSDPGGGKPLPLRRDAA